MSETNPTPPPAAELYDPGAHKADEVAAYLATADDAEKARVLDAERAGKNRVSLVGAAPEKVAGKQYADPSWAVGALAPASRYRIFDDKTAELGPVQEAAPKPGQSGVVVALEGAPITAGVRYELENN